MASAVSQYCVYGNILPVVPLIPPAHLRAVPFLLQPLTIYFIWMLL